MVSSTTPILLPRRVRGSSVIPFLSKVTSLTSCDDVRTVATITGSPPAPIIAATGSLARLPAWAPEAELLRNAATTSGPAATLIGVKLSCSAAIAPVVTARCDGALNDTLNSANRRPGFS